MGRRRTRWTAAIVAGGVGYAVLQWLGRSYGATRDERHGDLPGDHLVADPLVITDHAITIDAPREFVWPWLAQVGWHRGGWYTARWVDRLLFPANQASAEHLIPELQDLVAGSVIPDGPPESKCEFVVEALEANQHLVLHSRSHLPPGWSDRFGAWINWTWTFVLDDTGDGRTRFHFRCRAAVGPAWVAAMYRVFLAPADFVMARQMLRGVKTRAERTTAEMLAAIEVPRAPVDTSIVGTT